MKLKSRLFLVWAAYAFILILGTGVYKGQWLVAILIVLGSLFGVLLPKLICVMSEVLLGKQVTLNAAFFRSLVTLLLEDPQALMPTTKVGQLVYSYPFLFAFGLISLYIVTSSAEWFGKALVLGMGLRLMVDLLMSSRRSELLKARWFSAFPTKLSPMELKLFVYGSLGIWVVLTILALRS